MRYKTNFVCTEETSTTVLSTSLGKTFCLAFYFKRKFVLIDYILSETICPFCFCVLFSNIYCKIKFTVKNWSDLRNLYSKVIFFLNTMYLSKKIILLFFAEFELFMFNNNIVKLSEIWNMRNLLKICLPVTYPTDFCIICIHFQYGKKWKYLIFLKPND